MSRQTLPVALVLAAALAEIADLGAVSFYLLVAAVPVAAVAALGCFGDLVETPGGDAGMMWARLQSVLAALGLVWIVAAAATRAHAVEGDVPPVGVSALLACLVVVSAQAIVALAAPERPKLSDS
ncbi:MAG: hypothetical protein ACRDN6_05205 [Gaiellaceae bacterium]